MHKDVWILHPEHTGTAIAKGRSGIHYKVQKSKIPRGMPCAPGIQWVLVQDVFVPGIAPMYSSKQPGVRIMEDAMSSTSEDSTWVMWNTDYLREIL